MTTSVQRDYPGTELDVMSFAANYHRWILEEFALYLGEDVAEVGAGIGSFSRLLLETGIRRLVAFEPSPNMFAQLAATLEEEPRALAVNDIFRIDPGDGFDSIVYVNVLEHIEDDLAELAVAATALRPNGHLLVFVPALAWLYSEFDRQIGHYRRYTKQQLAELAEDVGLELINTKYFDSAGILPWYVAFKMLRTMPAAGGISLYDRLIVPPLRQLERLVAPPIGKNVLLIARKSAAQTAVATSSCPPSQSLRRAA